MPFRLCNIIDQPQRDLEMALNRSHRAVFADFLETLDRVRVPTVGTGFGHLLRLVLVAIHEDGIYCANLEMAHWICDNHGAGAAAAAADADGNVQDAKLPRHHSFASPDLVSPVALRLQEILHHLTILKQTLRRQIRTLAIDAVAVRRSRRYRDRDRVGDDDDGGCGGGADDGLPDLAGLVEASRQLSQYIPTNLAEMVGLMRHLVRVWIVAGSYRCWTVNFVAVGLALRAAGDQVRAVRAANRARDLAAVRMHISTHWTDVGSKSTGPVRCGEDRTGRLRRSGIHEIVNNHGDAGGAGAGGSGFRIGTVHAKRRCVSAHLFLSRIVNRIGPVATQPAEEVKVTSDVRFDVFRGQLFEPTLPFFVSFAIWGSMAAFLRANPLR